MIDPEKGQVFAKDRKLYAYSDPDVEIAVENVITADGWNNSTFPLLTANQSMPGPPIFLYQNQTITIIVQNNLLNEAVTIHWHGIDQLGSPAMDGVGFVTQCPILPGQFFNYTFKPRFSGSYWYHSHVGNQRDMGLYGAFVVLKQDEEVPLENQYIIQLQEWNHMYDPNTLRSANIKNTGSSKSILINGKGEFENNEAPLEVFTVDKKGSHLFRMIGVGSADTFLFSIPGIPLIVKETDGYPVVPQKVDKILIYPAERYDFELDLENILVGMYNITVQIFKERKFETQENLVGLGLIKITNSLSIPAALTSIKKKINSSILNCPFGNFPDDENVTCIPVSFLQSQNDKRFNFDVLRRIPESFTFFLNFGFPKSEGYSSINGRRFILPTVSALSQPSELDTSCANCTAETSCECTHALDLKSGSENIMVLSNVGNGATISHPIHMHGHTFEVLKMGFPAVLTNGSLIPNNDIQCSPTLPNDKSQCNNASWRNATWDDYRTIPDINLLNPVRKDTIVVPYHGYAIIRIRATNPGVWFLHCHIDRHLINGMALMLREAVEYIYIFGDLPEGLSTCRNFEFRTSAKQISNDEQSGEYFLLGNSLYL